MPNRFTTPPNGPNLLDDFSYVTSVDSPVADAGFLEGGFCYIIAHEFLKPHPLGVKTTPIFDRFGEKLLALLVN